MKARWLLNSVLLILVAGCASASVHKMGPDTYIATARGGMVTGGAAGAQSRSMDAAEAHCAAMGREVLVTSTDSRGTGIGTAQVIFRCLDANDPAYQRPNYRPTPNVIIENRQ